MLEFLKQTFEINVDENFETGFESNNIEKYYENVDSFFVLIALVSTK